MSEELFHSKKVTDVSVIIVNWNTLDILRNCLVSIYKETKNIRFEVIVVDNGSTDGSTRMVKDKFPQVVLIENSENKGYSAANNQGITIAQGRYILLLNSDCIIIDNAIAKTISFADSNSEAAVVSCRVLNSDRTLQSTCFMFPSLLNMVLLVLCLDKLFPGNRILGRERLSWCDRNNVLEVDVVAGCFMLVRREAIRCVGLMDERYFMYTEEADWCYRFKQAGWKIVFAPVGEIIHLGGESSKKKAVEMLLQLQGSTLLFFRKHNGTSIYVLACLLMTLFFLTRIPYLLCLAIISRNNKKDCIQKAKTYLKGSFYALVGGKGLCARR